jgi:hypothetical protein
MGDIIKRDIKEIVWEGWTGSMWVGMGSVVGSCEHSNEPLGFIKGREFLDMLRDYQLVKKDSAQRKQFLPF